MDANSIVQLYEFSITYNELCHENGICYIQR